MTVQDARDHLDLRLFRQRLAELGQELGRRLDSEWTLVPTVEEQFAPRAIQDDLLRMMFTCCHPRLPEEAQVALVLNILCGFSIREVAGDHKVAIVENPPLARALFATVDVDREIPVLHCL